MNTVAKYASLVKFSHTIFAMPFAVTAYIFALTSTDIPFDGWLLVKIILCMIFARNTAMGFNRWADRDIDAANPRTASREIPAGRISPRAALRFVIVNAIGFLIVAATINRLTLYLSPVALFIILSYSYAKRITAWVHVILGIALGIAPVGAYIAVTGNITFYPLILAGAVITWTAGFDILYSLQDADFDRQHALHSIPSRFSARTSSLISILLHLVTTYAIMILGILYDSGTLYWIGTALFITLLIVQHLLFLPSKTDRIGAAFGLMNGLASISFALLAIADMLFS